MARSNPEPSVPGATGRPGAPRAVLNLTRMQGNAVFPSEGSPLALGMPGLADEPGNPCRTTAAPASSKLLATSRARGLTPKTATLFYFDLCRHTRAASNNLGLGGNRPGSWAQALTRIPVSLA